MTRQDMFRRFVEESNRIEGITRPPTEAEIAELDRFVMLPRPTVEDLVKFVSVYQPNAVLRQFDHIPGVRVGNHIAPPSGPDIPRQLRALLEDIEQRCPFAVHCQYETLHPFTDGNGRSGRALWAWHMVCSQGFHGLRLGFLHMFYYQTLARVGR